ncbi:hypothetical protein LC087_04670 [Bacillus carboniphilus]|uniref:Uncharacterized protein n=1 Tax=Bacillus carboniphilus TaxID=86663 RepID=A0ABY9JXE1_9BACI|nr:hypothetical protein [Bacillus carboniphilus]WLR43469.1 hypothetical protein LC087_04670 [Bacillus carboniphilus]
MSIFFTSGPIDNTSLSLTNIEVRVRNTDPANSATVTVRFFDESGSPESLNQSNSFTVSAGSVESVLYSAASLTSFLVEVEVNLSNRSDTITATAVQPTVTAFNGSEFIQFIRLLVSSPEILQDINYPVTPQLNLFLPETIDCGAPISGNLTLNNVSQAGVDVSFSANTSGVTFVPNPATTDMNGNYETNVIVSSSKPATNAAISASATVNGQNVQSVGVAELQCKSELYVPNQVPFMSSVSVIDTDLNSVVDTITGFSILTGIDANSVTSLVYTYNNDLSVLSVIDASTNLIINTITAGNSVQRFGVAVNTMDNLIYLANRGSTNVTIIDGSTNIIMDTIEVGDGPTGLAVDETETRNLIYVSNNSSQNVSIIDGNNNFVVTATVTVGNVPRGLAINEMTNLIYVPNLASDSVSIIDGSLFVVTNTLTGFFTPIGIAVNEITNSVYVTNSDDACVSVIDGNLNVVTTTISVGDSPTGITVIEDLNQIYVVNGGSGNVSVIDGNTNVVTETVTVGTNPQNITSL